MPIKVLRGRRALGWGGPESSPWSRCELWPLVVPSWLTCIVLSDFIPCKVYINSNLRDTLGYGWGMLTEVKRSNSTFIMLYLYMHSAMYKSKGLLIDVPFYSCTYYMHSVSSSRLMIIILFIHGNHQHMKSKRHDINREPLIFCTWHCACKKYKDRTRRWSGAPCLVRVGSLTVRAFGSKPLALIGDTLIIGQSHTEHHYA
jgi:hypothetical protein